MIVFRTFLALLVGSALAFPVMAASPSNINKPRGVIDRESPREDETRFAKVIDDLPLMPGLAIEEEKDVLFITKQDRIAQTTATGMVDIDEVYHYYQRSLPQLGWKEINARTYERGSERLRIDVSGVNPEAKTVVRFSVEPVTGKVK